MILNKINDKKYIGSSNNVQSRLTQHNWLLRTNKHSNIYLQNSFNLFGENTIKGFNEISKQNGLFRRIEELIRIWPILKETNY